MSTFANALHEAVQASNDYRRACEDTDASTFDVDETAERLAQAGDVLEREMREMMREEARQVEATTGRRDDGNWGKVS
jgi:hypothetical protein